MICPNCGNKINEEELLNYEYKPISMWEYFGYQLLFMIPFIGSLALVIVALTHKNINVRNFARSYFCVSIILLILFALFIAMGIFTYPVMPIFDTV